MIVSCPVCDRPTRPRSTTVEQYPGTIVRATANGTCGRCYNREIDGLPPIAPDRHVFDPREKWMDAALCAQVDPEAFFPEVGGSTFHAKNVCASCEVRSQCLEYALRNDERYGIWGGTSERERRRMRRRSA